MRQEYMPSANLAARLASLYAALNQRERLAVETFLSDPRPTHAKAPAYARLTKEAQAYITAYTET